tara:strand:- start:2060 stop:2539 length:480 start_codon:yes stop_codon:yes gene_type:complete
MNRAEEISVERLWLDSWDSQVAGCNRIKSSLVSEGGGYPNPPDGSYYATAVVLQNGCGMYRIEGNFTGNNLSVEIFTGDLTNGYASLPFAGFFDVVIISTKKTGDFGELGNIRFIHDFAPFATIATYTINSTSHKTAAFRIIYSGDPANPWRTYSLNQF